MPEIINLMVALTGHFLAWTYVLGWFFSANWFDNLQHSDEDSELDITSTDGLNLMMVLLIVLAIGDIISLVRNGIENQYHILFTYVSYGYISILVLVGILTIREAIRERRGK